MDAFKSIINEEIEKLRKGVISKFSCQGEEKNEYEYILRSELPDWVNGAFTNIQRRVITQVAHSQEIKTFYINREIVDNNEFKKALIDTVLPLAMEHTQCFEIESNMSNAIRNIKTIVQYSPDSIPTVMEKIVNNLDVDCLKKLSEECPELKEHIFIDDKNEITEDNIEVKIERIEKKLEELIKRLNDGETISDESGKRGILEEILEQQIAVKSTYNELINGINRKKENTLDK